MTFLSLKNVSHTFFEEDRYTKVLDSISFDVKKGEFISILGPSGCGKSTLLSILANLLEHTEGVITIKNRLLKNASETIGYMLQQDYLFPWKSVLDNVLLGPKINKTISQNTEIKALELLEEVGLSNVYKHYPDQLSGGMRQRAALVRTLINDPEILLLDEPFSALDYFTKLKLENLVANILDEYEKTAILVTHDIGEAISMSDRIFLLTKSPASIAYEFEVPIELRKTKPFLCRRHKKYQVLFDKVWHAMNEIENQLYVIRGDKS